MPDPLQPIAAMRLHEGYRYTIVTIVNGAEPHTVEAGLWFEAAESEARWKYFRRCSAKTSEEACRRVEAEFKAWIDGQMEAQSEEA